MTILRVLHTFFVLVAAYVAEEYISAEKAFIKIGDLHFIEWQSTLNTIAVAVPAAVLVVLAVIWWGPIVTLLERK